MQVCTQPFMGHHGPSWAIIGYFWLLTIIFGFLTTSNSLIGSHVSGNTCQHIIFKNENMFPWRTGVMVSSSAHTVRRESGDCRLTVERRSICGQYSINGCFVCFVCSSCVLKQKKTITSCVYKHKLVFFKQTTLIYFRRPRLIGLQLRLQ